MKNTLAVLAALPLISALAACSGPSLYVPLPQSHFLPPNVNTQTGNHVTATVTRTSVLPFDTPDFSDANMQREAYLKALQGTGRDLIVDGDWTVRTTMIPLLFIVIMNIEGTVEGTAASITQMGRRQLQ